MPDLEKAIQAVYWAADSDQVGYAQDDRYDIEFYGPGLYKTDCSWLAIAALRYAGFDTGGASYSGNIVDELVARGWQKVRPDGNPQPGDILVAEYEHVAVMLYNGDLGQASIDENGGISGGRPGDQTGVEVNTRPYYDFPWDWYLRWPGGNAGRGSAGSAASGGSAWQGDMVGLSDTTGCGDDYAGVLGRPLRYVAIEGVGPYQAHDLGGGWWPAVDRYDLSDEYGGMAGAGVPIDAVRIEDESVCYQTHNLGGGWNPVMRGTRDTGGSADDYAGEYGVAQDAIRIWRDAGKQPRYNVFS
jgi:hypothetical protein